MGGIISEDAEFEGIDIRLVDEDMTDMTGMSQPVSIDGWNHLRRCLISGNRHWFGRRGYDRYDWNVTSDLDRWAGSSQKMSNSRESTLVWSVRV